MQVIKNAVVTMSEHVTNVQGLKLYVVVFNNKTLFVDINLADCIYAAVVRHVVRITKRTSSMRDSVYVMRSDIRALVREVSALQYAH